MFDVHHAPFILIGQSRSGSTMLRRILNSHQDICCHGELFLKGRVRAYANPIDGVAKEDRFEWLLQKRESDFGDFINSYVFPKNDPIAATGFKILDQQFFIAENEDRVRGLIEAVQQIKLIFLYRENILSRFLSRLIRRKKLDPNQSQHVSVKDFLLYQAASEGCMTRIYRLFPEHRKIVLQYEHVIEQIDDYTQMICGFLNVPPAPVKVSQKKNPSYDLRKIITNYDELLDVYRPDDFRFEAHDDSKRAMDTIAELQETARAKAAYDLGRQFAAK